MQYIQMVCPLCQQVMALHRQDISYTKDRTKVYDRRQFVCSQDDVWLKLETPQQPKSSLVMEVAQQDTRPD